MTDREALDRMKFMAKGGTNFSEKSHEACRIAAEAIRERIDREKGCECCNQHNAMELGAKVYNQSVSYFIVGDGYPHSEKHRFCPMCGRQLKTAMPGEEQHG